MSEEQTGMTDDQLIAIVRGDTNNEASWTLVCSMAEQLLKHRRRARGDTRRAEQFRKLRWAVEHVTTKMEELTRSSQLEDRQLSAQLIEVCKIAIEGIANDEELQHVRAILHAAEVEHG